MEYIEVSAKTVEDAISEAAIKLEVPSDKIEYEVITEGSTGFLGLIGSKPAVIKARKKFNLLDHTKDFLARLFKAMNVDVNSTVDYDEESRTMNIVFDGEDMGLLIGKRGQTLDSLQYLTNRVANKMQDGYVRVKLDTEDYRRRRKETLEREVWCRCLNDYGVCSQMTWSIVTLPERHIAIDTTFSMDHTDRNPKNMVS